MIAVSFSFDKDGLVRFKKGGVGMYWPNNKKISEDEEQTVTAVALTVLVDKLINVCPTFKTVCETLKGVIKFEENEVEAVLIFFDQKKMIKFKLGWSNVIMLEYSALEKISKRNTSY